MGWGYAFHQHSDLTHPSTVQPPWIQAIKLKHLGDITLKEVSEIPFSAADSPLESAMPFHPVSQREATMSPSSRSTNLECCQGYLQPKDGNVVSYHKKQSYQCRCLICALLCRSLLNGDAQPILYQRTNVNFHPQFRLHTSLKSTGQKQIPWPWTQLCVTPVLTLLTVYIILYNPFQRVP